jgi:hypothetical protein
MFKCSTLANNLKFRRTPLQTKYVYQTTTNLGSNLVGNSSRIIKLEIRLDLIIKTNLDIPAISPRIKLGKKYIKRSRIPTSEEIIQLI